MPGNCEPEGKLWFRNLSSIVLIKFGVHKQDLKVIHFFDKRENNWLCCAGCW